MTASIEAHTYTHVHQDLRLLLQAPKLPVLLLATFGEHDMESQLLNIGSYWILLDPIGSYWILLVYMGQDLICLPEITEKPG